MHGLHSIVETDDGRQYRCTVRRVLRTLATEGRNIVATGDRVWFLPAEQEEGIIERVEPRHGLLTRASRGREHVLVANVDQVVIVTSRPAQAAFARSLFGERPSKARADLCLNKADLVDLVAFQPLVGMYSQRVPVILTSILTGVGIDRLRTARGRDSFPVRAASANRRFSMRSAWPGTAGRSERIDTRAGTPRQPPASARLRRLGGGHAGHRQFELWDIIRKKSKASSPNSILRAALRYPIAHPEDAARHRRQPPVDYSTTMLFRAEKERDGRCRAKWFGFSMAANAPFPARMSSIPCRNSGRGEGGRSEATVTPSL